MADKAKSEAARLLGAASAVKAGLASARAASPEKRKERAAKGGQAAQAKLTKEERSRRAKLRWARWRDEQAKVEPFRDGVPCGHPGCLNHVSHPCEGCGRMAKREKGER